MPIPQDMPEWKLEGAIAWGCLLTFADTVGAPHALAREAEAFAERLRETLSYTAEDLEAILETWGASQKDPDW